MTRRLANIHLLERWQVSWLQKECSGFVPYATNLISACTLAGYHHYQRPVYSIDLDSSIYTSYEYKHNEHVFKVEQGTQFYLKLNLKATRCRPLQGWGSPTI